MTLTYKSVLSILLTMGAEISSDVLNNIHTEIDEYNSLEQYCDSGNVNAPCNRRMAQIRTHFRNILDMINRRRDRANLLRDLSEEDMNNYYIMERIVDEASYGARRQRSSQRQTSRSPRRRSKSPQRQRDAVGRFTSY